MGDLEQCKPTADALMSVYTVLTARRTTFDTLMWQVPVLGLTAQAFLLTIALGSDSSHAARLIAGTLAFLIAAISMQTMSKWRRGEVVDSKLIERLEKQLGLDTVVGVAPHDRLAARAAMVDQPIRGWARWSSYRLWMLALALFATASLTAVGITVWRPSLL